MECGTLMVPLDYTNDMSNDTVQLELVRLKSSNCSPKGSILLNFGGPGADGRADFGLFGPRMQAYVRPQTDNNIETF